ncbi:hypothetical protein ACWGRK_00825 [Saccharomonospora azurea]|uniref:Excreted virulence factor EspC, type VII ESX diderm n=1 Tax=Saccharomonospora azurea NA-128 TaxID=882081 RepID=H8GFL4_9PSEU|nr:hypothetical protein [Saccharomonospora azurea]EHK87978.1 hypothetical protein SZMC14600_07576 [Saccharomonospora azurea SZMC 14600]EHY90076.1 Protein of unknown function (DUF2580) [Saccharomonospora azurea NA-128]
MSGYHVAPEQLDAYSRALSGHRSAVERVKGLVDQADVSDKSWGVVGIFVKDQYTGMLGDFNDLLDDLSFGLQSGSDKMRSAAEQYRSAEQEAERSLREVLLRINAAKLSDKAV